MIDIIIWFSFFYNYNNIVNKLICSFYILNLLYYFFSKKINLIFITFIGNLTILKNNFYDYISKNSGIEINKIIIDHNQVLSSKEKKYINNNYLKILELYPNYSTIFISYYIKNKEFYIIYSNNNRLENIKFPIYSAKDSYKKKAFDTTSDDIILFEIISNDNNNKSLHFFDNENENKILDLIQKFSGPKGNFYINKNYDIHKEKINIINYINNNLNTNVNYDIKFKILYSNLNKLII